MESALWTVSELQDSCPAARASYDHTATHQVVGRDFSEKYSSNSELCFGSGQLGWLAGS